MYEYKNLDFTIESGVPASTATTRLTRANIAAFDAHPFQAARLKEVVAAFVQARDQSLLLKSTDIRFDICLYSDGLEVRVSYLNKSGIHQASCHFSIANTHPTLSAPTALHLDNCNVRLKGQGASGALINALRTCWQGNKILKNLPLVISAIHTGAYTWLKYGVTPHKAAWKRISKEVSEGLLYDPQKEELSIRLLCDHSLACRMDMPEKKGQYLLIATCTMPPDQYAALQSILHSDNASAIADLNKATIPAPNLPKKLSISPITLGKALMCGNEWVGQLDPSDEKQMARFNHYTDHQLAKVMANDR